MGWNEYHKTAVFSFGEQQHTYYGAINNLARKKPEIISPDRPLTFVLGGFHPYSDTADSFMEFCTRIHPHPQDRHILLDQSALPLNTTTVTPSAKIQARLENLPLAGNSVDYIFLDNTLDYMDPGQVQRFTINISQVLKPDGLVLAMMKSPLLLSWGRVWGSLRSRVPVHLYSARHLKQITSPSLNLVLEAINDTGFLKNFCLRVFARRDSSFPEHQGESYIYDRGFCYPEKIGTGLVLPNSLETYLNPGSLQLNVKPVSALDLQPVGFSPCQKLECGGR